MNKQKVFVIKRCLLAIPTIIGVVVLIFVLTRFVPGDPVNSFVGRRADARIIEKVREEFGLDKPFFVQFFYYVKSLARGDMGYSYVSGQPVSSMIAKRFPNTLKLACTAMVLAVLSGIAMGFLSVLKPGGFIDRACMFLSVSGISIPVFWFGLILIIVFSNILGWFPASGMGGPSYIILPALTLATRSSAYIARITRSSVLEVLGENFVVTARAKGLSRTKVLMKHVLKNALIPVVTLIGIDLGSYLNGSVLTESIFGWNGIGNLALNGIMNRDYPVIMGTVLFGSVIFIFANILVDVSYSIFNPRISYESK